MATTTKARRKKAKPSTDTATKPRTRAKATTKATPKTKAEPKAKTSKVKVVNKSGESRYGHERNALGFVPGSDSALIAAALVDGGESRGDVTAKAREAIKESSGLKTRNGTDKDVAGLTAGVLRRMIEDGFTVSSSFTLVPPPEKKAALAAEKRKAARKKKKTA